MIDQHKVSLFKELLQQAESILVIYAPDALRDHLFAATALYKTLQQLGTKDVALLSSENLSSDEPDIAYLSEIKTEIGRKNLCITLDYTSDAVEKITSAVDENIQKLHITIKPKKGNTPLSKENVSFSYTGADADMVILVGVDDLESLDQLYIGYENLYQSTALVSINSYETAFGNLKLDIQSSSSVSEYVTELLKALEYQLDQESATNLLAGIDEETENLESYLATADTFEVVAYLLRSGARRFARKKKDSQSSESGVGAEVGIFDAKSGSRGAENLETNFNSGLDLDLDLDSDLDSDSDSDSDDDVVVVDSDEYQQDTQFEAIPDAAFTAQQARAPHSAQPITSFVAQLAEKHQAKLRTQEKLDPFEKLLQQSPKTPKRRGRGRPKGSLNKNRSEAQKKRFSDQPEFGVQSKQGDQSKQGVQSKQGTQPNPNKQPKPGDLGYNPSGFGPSAV